MKRVLKLTLFAVILIMTMMMSKPVLADERKDAKVDYEYNSDGTAKVTITFSESVEGFNTLIESGWQLSGNTATKTMKPGEWYIYMDDTEQAKVVVNNIAKVGDTITINSSSNPTLTNLKLDDASYGTVSGNKITFNKEGKTSYSADVTYIKDENTVGNFELKWEVKITKDGKNPVNPTDAGVLVTVKFSQNIPNTADIKEKLKDWNISGNTATRTMKQGAVAAISVKYEDGSTESAKIAVPLTLEIGSKVDFSNMAKNLKIENTEIATVENGVITAKASGETKMTGIANVNNEEYTWTIKVKGTGNDNSGDNGSHGNNGNNGNNGNSGNNGSGQNSGSQSGNSNSKKDSTVSKTKLSKTGSVSVAPIFAVLIVIAGISFIKYRKNNK